MNTLNTSLPRRETAPRPAWRPGVWTFSLVIGWLALLAALMLVATGDHAVGAVEVPSAEAPFVPII